MGRTQFDRILAQHCAPTLAGIKAASMVALPAKSMADLQPFFQRYEQCFECKGLKVLELRQQKRHVLLLLYRPVVLQRLLRRPLAQQILASCGYPEGADLKPLLAKLISRIKAADDFPHEIGLFLGYPPKDVEGFIRCQGKDFCHCGFWKVYSNEKAVRRLFQCYDKCIKRVCANLQAGQSLQAMICSAA